jgi:hypothetical protein
LSGIYERADIKMERTIQWNKLNLKSIQQN